MRILLCALTGMGTHILQSALSWPRLEDISVFTRKEKGVFPYYPCRQLDEVCEEASVDYHYASFRDNTTEALVDAFAPDLLLCATYHQLIPANILQRQGMKTCNIHPSLLPAYRGPTPTNWAILNGEQSTGITFHTIRPEIDAGEIYHQCRLPIGNETDGELREAAAIHAAEALHHVLNGIKNETLSPTPQNDKEASWYPNINSDEGRQLIEQSSASKQRKIRALSPLPGLPA